MLRHLSGSTQGAVPGSRRVLFLSCALFEWLRVFKNSQPA
jgi:hypothetical protein